MPKCITTLGAIGILLSVSLTRASDNLVPACEDKWFEQKHWLIESTKGPKALNEVAHVLKNYVGFSVIEVFDHAVAADGRPLPIDGMVIAYQGDGGSHIQIALEKVVGFSGIELGCVAHTSFDGQMNFLGL